jgi:hypothetical protein
LNPFFSHSRRRLMTGGIAFWYLAFPIILLGIAVVAHIVDPPGKED